MVAQYSIIIWKLCQVNKKKQKMADIYNHYNQISAEAGLW